MQIINKHAILHFAFIFAYRSIKRSKMLQHFCNKDPVKRSKMLQHFLKLNQALFFMHLNLLIKRSQNQFYVRHGSCRSFWDFAVLRSQKWTQNRANFTIFWEACIFYVMTIDFDMHLTFTSIIKRRWQEFKRFAVSTIQVVFHKKTHQNLSKLFSHITDKTLLWPSTPGLTVVKTLSYWQEGYEFKPLTLHLLVVYKRLLRIRLYTVGWV